MILKDTADRQKYCINFVRKPHMQNFYYHHHQFIIAIVLIFVSLIYWWCCLMFYDTNFTNLFLAAQV